MAVVDVALTFPHAPITSLQKRIEKGVEHLYYVKLFLSSPDYADGGIWRRWHELGFHLAIFSPPPGTSRDDRIRVRMQFPSATPRISVTGTNIVALSDLEALLEHIDAERPSVKGGGAEARAKALTDGPLGASLVHPLVAALGQAGLGDDVVAAYQAMLQRAFDALTDDDLTSIEVSAS